MSHTTFPTHPLPPFHRFWVSMTCLTCLYSALQTWTLPYIHTFAPHTRFVFPVQVHTFFHLTTHIHYLQHTPPHTPTHTTTHIHHLHCSFGHSCTISPSHLPFVHTGHPPLAVHTGCPFIALDPGLVHINTGSWFWEVQQPART